MKTILFFGFIALLIVGALAHNAWNHSVPVQSATFVLDSSAGAYIDGEESGIGGFGPNRAQPSSKTQYRPSKSQREEDHWHLTALIDGKDRMVRIPVAMVPEGDAKVTVDFQVLKNGIVEVLRLASPTPPPSQ